MHPFAIPLAFVILGATDVSPSFAPPARDEPLAAMREFRPGDAGVRRCNDGNLPAGDRSSGQPRLERGPATADMGQYIYALDRRLDGCSVILAMNSGIKPRGEMKLSPEEMAEFLGRR